LFTFWECLTYLSNNIGTRYYKTSSRLFKTLQKYMFTNWNLLKQNIWYQSVRSNKVQLKSNGQVWKRHLWRTSVTSKTKKKKFHLRHTHTHTYTHTPLPHSLLIFLKACIPNLNSNVRVGIRVGTSFFCNFWSLILTSFFCNFRKVQKPLFLTPKLLFLDPKTGNYFRTYFRTIFAKFLRVRTLLVLLSLSLSLTPSHSLPLSLFLSLSLVTLSINTRKLKRNNNLTLQGFQLKLSFVNLLPST